MTYDRDNIFARIIRGEIPCKKIYEDDYVFAMHDVNPAAPVHVLVLPKGEYKSFDDFALKAASEYKDHFFRKIQEIAQSLGLSESGYRLIANHGMDASQSVVHFHVHILGKKHLGALVAGDTHHQ